MITYLYETMGNGVKRDALGRLLPGTAMVPGCGRPKGFKGVAAAIMKESRNGDEFKEFLFKVFRNESGAHTHKDQIEALKILYDRGLGKAMTTIIELDPDEHPAHMPLDDISSEGLSDVARALAKALEIK